MIGVGVHDSMLWRVQVCWTQGRFAFSAAMLDTEDMNLDDKICYCFHVTRRKLVNFCRRTKPRVPSQLAECGGAGTGCGWCIPFLKQIYKQSAEGGLVEEMETLTPQEYEARRAEYIRAGKGTPPASAKQGGSE